MKLQTRVPPLALAAGAALAQHLLARASTPRSNVRLAAASGLAAASTALLGSSVMEFRRNRTSVNPMSPDVVTALVTEGPHRFTRNPMYVGMAGLLAANAVARGRLIAVVPVVGFVLAIDRLQIPAEETALRARFPDDYDAYVRAVPRWLGRSSLRVGENQLPQGSAGR